MAPLVHPGTANWGSWALSLVCVIEASLRGGLLRKVPLATGRADRLYAVFGIISLTLRYHGHTGISNSSFNPPQGKQMSRFAMLSITLALIGPLVAAGQPPQPPETVKAMELPLQQFEMLLVPQKKAQLEQLASRWQDQLEEHATTLARAKVLARRSGDGAETAKVAELTQQQAAIAARYDVVIDALEAKSGEVAEHRAYLKSVTAQNVLENPTLLTTSILTWLQSPEGGLRWGVKLAGFLGILIAARFLASMASSLVERTLRVSKLKVTELLSSFFVSTTRNVVMALGVMVGLALLGLPVGPFLAAMGAVGFIIGFALQDTLGNFASGVMILFYRPYDLEDVITVAGVTGKVRAMSLVSTTLLSPDNQVVVVPNQKIWGGIITNITGNATRRVDLVFGISYDDDVRHAQNVLEQLVVSH
ncbi:MAG: mechanosensitive ion channel family protein, partial [Planctomycetales bacterium]|nr:mechanosensitive ion channel family protein [Planctomycetales bacterium]